MEVLSEVWKVDPSIEFNIYFDRHAYLRKIDYRLFSFHIEMRTTDNFRLSSKSLLKNLLYQIATVYFKKIAK